MGLISNGTTLLDAGAISAAKGSLTLIKTLTASSSATLSFVDGSASVVLDSTYKEYIFKFYDIHPATDNADLQFNGSIDAGSNYNIAKTSTNFRSYHFEGDTEAVLAYLVNEDQANGTDYQHLTNGVGIENDMSCNGELYLFNPSSTTFVKHFMCRFQFHEASPGSFEHYTSGYFNTTSAIDEIQFKMSSGNIDAGDIKLYGIKDS